ncbi:hypothetical protein [Streptomyces bambusae]|uniref:Uncharacterized protein n=1 Tax=Streptomyces bambusae TaxID=1550616 RepID=A0ABS6Z3A4_9ACTN|nr:hypothetical protein [Streptomyces bambusae]MBW5482243.1 hypothetical protein [Streptomyces bambusae]
MPILKPKTSHSGAPSASDFSVALLPLVAVLPALATMFADRLSTAGWAALIAVELMSIATVSAWAARGVARAAAERARRDAEVLDMLEPLAGTRR